ncbi:hypothetical protein AYO50_00805 [Acidobacteria bacterium SCGC AG-212-P17]|nr:hypothetical protein AYO50_00805 [Acidobacteria bacterium SCGC AG-212-P17]
MNRDLRLTFAALVLFLSQQLSWAQQPAADSSKAVATAGVAPKTGRKVAPADSTKPAKLTPDQILAGQTLEVAESQARGLDAPMRSYSLLQIAGAFTASNPEKARSLLQDAFSASLAIQDNDDMKREMQIDIFRTMLPLSQSDVEERLAQADEDARKMASGAIIQRYTDKKQFDRAVDLVQQVTSLGEFPYGPAAFLLEALPPEMNAEKQAMMASAVASYRAHDHKQQKLFGGGDLTTLVIRYGESMPPKLALEAIDEILSQTRKNDDPLSVTVGGEGGSASFKSMYEYQLFALMPLLRKLDESHANRLVEEDSALRTTMQQYPKGMDSVSPPPTDNSKPSKGTSFMIGKGGGNQASSQATMMQEMERRKDLILKQADTDPTQAIAQAAALPLSISSFGPSPRASALEAIARTNFTKHPAAARQALAELRKSIQDLQPRLQAKYLSSAAKMYLEMDDKDRAEDVVHEGLKVAAKMLDEDINPDDPNKALKAWWPSADAYRQMVEVETKISHPATSKLLEEIKDPDIRTVESITFARALLGLNVKFSRFVVQRKDMNVNLRMGTE